MPVPFRCAIALVVLMGVTGCSAGVTGTAAVGSIAPTTRSTQSSATTPSTVRSTPESTSSATTNSATTSSATTSAIDDSSVVDTSVVDTSGAAPTSDAGTLASGVTIEELADDLIGAEEVVGGFWATHWTDFFTGSYEPPVVRGLYDGTDPSDTPTCDGVPLDVENAYYCEAEDYVAWDATLLLRGADEIGDSWVYLVVAHQWGQAMQARLDPSLIATGSSLQADCLAAAALFGAVADGTLTFDPGDEAELIGSLSILADEMPWTMASDHGDSFERVQWFTLGRNDGVDGCLDVVESSAPPTG